MLLAAAVAIIVLGAGLIAGADRPPRDRARRSPAPGRRSPAPAGTPGTAAPQVPHVDLAGLRWGDFHGVELPSSPAAGPRNTSGGLASGFADTPLGALLAAVNIGVRANAQWGPAIFGPTIRDQVTGADAPALLAGCQSAYDQASQAAHVTGGQPLGNAYVTEEAFRWIAYTPADATVDLVSAGPGSQGDHGARRHPDRGRLGRRRLAGHRPAGRRLGQLGRPAVLAGRIHRLPGSGVNAMSCPVLIDPACVVIGKAVGTVAGTAASGALSGIASAIESGVAWIVSQHHRPGGSRSPSRTWPPSQRSASSSSGCSRSPSPSPSSA